jgi:hypothetical protein
LTKTKKNKMEEVDAYILVGSDDQVYGLYQLEPTKEEILEILRKVQTGNIIEGLHPERIICYACKAVKTFGGDFSI